MPVTPYLMGPECRPVWQMRATQCASDPRAAAWVTGLVWAGSINKAVGAAGFHGPPGAYGVVEIGYRIDPGHRRRGYGKAALGYLLARAARNRSVSTVRARICADNIPSQRLSTQFGFRKTGEQWDADNGLEHIYERSAR